MHSCLSAGYRITVAAASPDQTAITLTQGAAFANRFESPQETLRTSSFPARHIKVRDAHGGCWGPAQLSDTAVLLSPPLRTSTCAAACPACWLLVWPLQRC